MFEDTETDGLGVMCILLEMFRFKREMEFMDEHQATDTLRRFSGGEAL